MRFLLHFLLIVISAMVTNVFAEAATYTINLECSGPFAIDPEGRSVSDTWATVKVPDGLVSVSTLGNGWIKVVVGSPLQSAQATALGGRIQLLPLRSTGSTVQFYSGRCLKGDDLKIKLEVN